MIYLTKILNSKIKKKSYRDVLEFLSVFYISLNDK